MLRGMRQLDAAIDALAFTGANLMASLRLTMIRNVQNELVAIGDDSADPQTSPVIYMR